jgi:predicted nucleic acid-binding protein
MSLSKIFFDTNVLVYAHDESANYHTESASLLKMAVKNQTQGVIAEQNLIELYRIITNPVAMKGSPLTSSQARDLITETYLRGGFEIIYPNSSTTNRTLEIAVSGNFISAKIFDIRLAALILSAKTDYFATYNLKDFQNIGDLNPLTPAQILARIPT